MDEVFTNSRSGAKARELRAYQTESESEAKARLEAAGWSFSIPYEFDDNQKLFTVGSGGTPGTEDADPEGEV